MSNENSVNQNGTKLTCQLLAEEILEILKQHVQNQDLPELLTLQKALEENQIIKLQLMQAYIEVQKQELIKENVFDQKQLSIIDQYHRTLEKLSQTIRSNRNKDWLLKKMHKSLRILSHYFDDFDLANKINFLEPIDDNYPDSESLDEFLNWLSKKYSSNSDSEESIKETPINGSDKARFLKPLYKIINNLHFDPDSAFEKELNEFKNQLGPEIDLKILPEKLDQLGSLIGKCRNAFSETQEQFTNLLQDLVKEIFVVEKEMTKVVSNGLKNREESNKQFEQEFTQAISGLNHGLTSTPDIEQIRKSTKVYLSNLKSILQSKLEDDSGLRQQLEGSISQMQVQLNALQQKSEHLQKEASIDSLTNLYNRRAIDQKLSEELRRLQRYSTTFSILIYDIDDFKKINDQYGHIAGDRVLKKIADINKEMLRDLDILGRFGGEEFLAILPNSNLKEASLVAEKIRLNTSNINFSYRGKTGVRVTISIGVAQAKSHDDPQSLIERADAALYLAKETGKNRIMTEEDLLATEL